MEDLCSIPGLGRSPGEGNGYLLQYSGLENSVDYEVLGVTKSQIGLSDFHFTLSSKGRTIQFLFIFLTEIPFKSLCWHIFLKNVYVYLFECVHIYICICVYVCVCVYICILDNDVKNISDDVEKNTIIRSNQRFKR